MSTIARRGTAVWVVCVLVLLTACATVPTGGPIVRGEGNEGSVNQGDPYVRLIPVPPQPGVGERGLIHDFLSSVGSFENDYRAARAYMTPERQETWEPNGTTLVYSDSSALNIEVTTGEDERNAKVRLRAAQRAVITPDGQYEPAEEGATIDVTFRLTKVAGEWRIADLPSELILDSRDVDRVYRPLNLYFFNADRDTLVPDTVLLPAHATKNLPNELARRVVEGPTDWLEPAVRTAFPEGTTANVGYQSNRLTVDLSSEARQAGAEDRYAMAAQLVWTVRQLSEVQELRLRVEGHEISVPGVEEQPLQTADGAWDTVDPAGISENARAYFLREGQLWSLDGEQRETLIRDMAGVDGTPLDQHAISLDENRIAGIAADGRRVLVSDMAAGDYRTVLSGGRYTALSWDGHGNLWVAEDTSTPEVTEGDGDGAEENGGDTGRAESGDGGDEETGDAERPDDTEPGTRLWLVKPGGELVEVRSPELVDRSVEQLRASRDGTRVAVLLDGPDGAEVSVGRVVHSGDGVTLDYLIPLGAEFDRIADIAWRGADELALLVGDEGGATEVYLVPADGNTEFTSAGATAGADMESITAAPSQPLLAGVDDDYLWLTSDRLLWQRVTGGTSPVYPG